jgi:hypothetical protein
MGRHRESRLYPDWPARSRLPDGEMHTAVQLRTQSSPWNAEIEAKVLGRKHRLLPAPQPGVEQVAQGIAEHVEAEDCSAQGHPWPDG